MKQWFAWLRVGRWFFLAAVRKSPRGADPPPTAELGYELSVSAAAAFAPHAEPGGPEPPLPDHHRFYR